jgi:hypothetical protein
MLTLVRRMNCSAKFYDANQINEPNSVVRLANHQSSGALAMHTRFMLLGFATLLVILPAFARSASQTAVAIVSEKQPIPAGYKTYSLFLICNPNWLDPSKSGDLANLYHKFQAFGRSIGDDQAAIWFWRTNVRDGWENTMTASQAIDVERSIHFCQAWKLKPSEGPFLVVTAVCPDEKNLSNGVPDESAVFQLGSLTPTQISVLLSKLTDSLLMSGKVDASLSPPPPVTPPAGDSTTSRTGEHDPVPSAPVSTALWVRMLAATQQIIGEFGCAVTLKINAGPLSADLNSCKGHS